MTLKITDAPFNAVGDGITTCTAAIQAALDQANANGGEDVLVPHGVFLTDSLTLYPKVTLRGEDNASSTLKARCPNCVLLTYTASVFASGFTIKNLNLDSGGMTNVILIKLDGVNGTKRIGGIFLTDLVFTGLADTAVWLRYAAGTWIRSCTSIQPANGFVIDNCADTNITDASAVLGSGTGFKVLGTPGDTHYDEGLRLTGCVTNGQAMGLTIDHQDWGIATGCSFTTCSGGAVHMYGGTNWKFSNCEFASAANNPGFWGHPETGINNVIITGCQFLLNNFGVLISGKAWIVTSNYFSAGSNADIMLLGAVECTVITNNNCASNAVPWSIVGNAGVSAIIVRDNVVNGGVSSFGPRNNWLENLQY